MEKAYNNKYFPDFLSVPLVKTNQTLQNLETPDHMCLLNSTLGMNLLTYHLHLNVY